MNTQTAMARREEAQAPHTSQAQPSRQTQEEATLMPPVDVMEDASGITVYADLPGVSKDHLDLHIGGGTLTLAGRLALQLPRGLGARHAEVGLSRFRRTFTLSKDLDADKVSAELNHGVLTLRIPKAEHAQPRRIEVRVD
mgnify:CR=1 FL=1